MAKAAHDAKWRPRVEDEPLLRGLGRFVAYVPAPGQLIGCFVRSPHAFARIRGIDAEAARRAPGVRGIFTAAEMQAAGVGNTSVVLPLKDRDGNAMFIPSRPSLAATDRAWHPWLRRLGGPVLILTMASPALASNRPLHRSRT
jgi:CO/xanthine dehydrogenase Mo-binding subunit